MPLAEALRLLNSSAKVSRMPGCDGSLGSWKSLAPSVAAWVLRSTRLSPPPRLSTVSAPTWVSAAFTALKL